MPRRQACSNPICGNTFRHGYPGSGSANRRHLYCSDRCMYEHGNAIGGRITKRMREPAVPQAKAS